MKAHYALALILSLLGYPSFSAVITANAGAKTGMINVESKDVPVSLVGSGLRSKKVFVMNVKVYTAELFASDAAAFKRNGDEALNSLLTSKTVGIRLNFLRSVDANKVQASFKDALTTNKVDLKDAGVDEFLKAVSAGGEASDGKSLTVVGQKNADGSESVYYEDTAGKVTKVSGVAGLIKNIFSIWLGAPADSGVAKLKDEILKN